MAVIGAVASVGVISADCRNDSYNLCYDAVPETAFGTSVSGATTAMAGTAFGSAAIAGATAIGAASAIEQEWILPFIVEGLLHIH